MGHKDDFLQIATYSDIGTRANNEDRVRAEKSDRWACITLADGVGGQGGGSTAATAVTGKMSELFMNLWKNSQDKEAERTLHSRALSQTMRRLLDEVNKTVLNLQTLRCRMQATCVTLWIVNTKDAGWQALWGHVGDSRLYLFANGRLVMHTEDHSMAEKLRKYHNAESVIPRNVIWQAMGEPEGISPEISEPIKITGQNLAFLLCSDGLWECIGDDRIEEALKKSENPAEWLQYLQKALKNTGKKEYDNHTAAAIFIKGDRL